MRRILLKLWRRRQLHQDLETELAFHRDLAQERANPTPLRDTRLTREQGQRNRVYCSLLERRLRPASMAGHGGVERGVIEIVSGNYFSALGVRAWQGRVFTDDDNRVPMGHPVTVVSYRYWRDRLSSDPTIIGKTVHIDHYPFKVIGVAPRGFFGMEVGSAPDAWAPIMMQPQLFLGGMSVINGPWKWLEIVGRRAPGVSEPQAQAAATLLLQQIQAGQTLPRFAPRDIK